MTSRTTKDAKLDFERVALRRAARRIADLQRTGRPIPDALLNQLARVRRNIAEIECLQRDEL